MSRFRTEPVELLPILSRGKHRRPRQGACFMEFASYLAGERWSDHPACTHPLLASLARQVNDNVSHSARQRLLPHVPDVIGLTSDDPRVEAVIALRAASTALPVAAEERQRVLALAVLKCDALLAELEGQPDAELSAPSRAALAAAPGAAAWARKHARDFHTSRRVFRRQTAPAIVSCAVIGIAQACGVDPDPLLRGLLIGAIEDCRRFRPPTPAPDEQPVRQLSEPAARDAPARTPTA